MRNLVIKLNNGQVKELSNVNRVIVNTDDAVINTNVRDFYNLGGALSYVFCPADGAELTLPTDSIQEITYA